VSTRAALDRRGFLALGAAALAWPRRAGAAEKATNEDGALTDVPGVTVGHFTDARRPTGCTAVLVERGAVGGADVRGGAPGTREIELLDPVNTVAVVHGVLLAGGSAFGLDAAGGVVRFLEERGAGFRAGSAVVPIVPAAILFDLEVGDGRIRPDAAAGHAAARAASAGAVAEGSVGAGAGATVGKMWGMGRAMKGGVGTASLRLPGGTVVAALAVVNAFGDVVDERGQVIAGARSADGTRLDPALPAILGGAAPGSTLGGRNTTLAVVATNVPLTKAETKRVAWMAQGGLARAIVPAHTPVDGDTVFVLSVGGAAGRAESPLVVGTLAAEAVARAIRRGVRTARALPALPAAGDLVGGSFPHPPASR
jgi:L-aminopeptidase/D-esterase-like protein